GDGGGLDDHQRHAAGRPAAEVDQVPVVREPVPGDVLAHGGHHDAVAERHAADRERAEEVDLGHLTVVVGPGRAAASRGLLRLVGGVPIPHPPPKGPPQRGLLLTLDPDSLRVHKRMSTEMREFSTVPAVFNAADRYTWI